jgi:hypothetical protein
VIQNIQRKLSYMSADNFLITDIQDPFKNPQNIINYLFLICVAYCQQFPAIIAHFPAIIAHFRILNFFS